MLLRKAIVPAIDLARPATVARQRGSTNFTACVVPQIIPVDMEATVVPPVNHLVRKRILQMRFAEEAIGTQQDTSL